MKKPIVDQAMEYVRDNTGIRVDSLEPYPGALPPFLEQLYQLHVVYTAVGRFLMIERIGEELITPLKYEKHLARIMKTAPGFDTACAVFERLPFYVRQRYAGRGIAFIVPGTQLNWPQLGLALQQRSRAAKISSRQDVMPATQLLLLYTVTKGITAPASVKAIADLLSYSPMTISRVFDQLETKAIGKVERRGRVRVVTFNPNRRELWEQISGLLDSPVGQEVRIPRDRLDGGEYFLAGETALAQGAPLIEPQEWIYAVSLNTWNRLKANLEELPVPDESTCILQVWRYDPGILQTNGVVDPYSMWLSMRGTADERLQIALAQLCDEDHGWKISNSP